MALLLLLLLPHPHQLHHIGSSDFHSLLQALPVDWPDKLSNWSSGLVGLGRLQYCITIQDTQPGNLFTAVTRISILFVCPII